MPARRRVLILVTTDPKTSLRPAEAVRVAAGLAAWQEVDVTLCLKGAAGLLESGPWDAIQDGVHCQQNLAAFRQDGGILVIDPDYRELLAAIFRADSVVVW